MCLAEGAEGCVQVMASFIPNEAERKWNQGRDRIKKERESKDKRNNRMNCVGSE